MTGAISSTVVTLSSSEENTAVTSESMNNIPHGLALTFFADHTATYWKTPLPRVMATITIIPANNPSVLKSIPEIAVSWFRTPSVIIRLAPSPATIARLTLSQTIRA